jgi:hypothetical protein
LKRAKKRLEINWEANITNLPDFNPIERIWRIIKQRLKSRGLFYSKEELQRAAEEELDKLTLEEISKGYRAKPCCPAFSGMLFDFTERS